MFDVSGLFTFVWATNEFIFLNMSKRTNLILKLAKNATNKTTASICELPPVTENEIIFIGNNNNTSSTDLSNSGSNSTNIPAVAVISVNQDSSNEIGDDTIEIHKVSYFCYNLNRKLHFWFARYVPKIDQ